MSSSKFSDEQDSVPHRSTPSMDWESNEEDPDERPLCGKARTLQGSQEKRNENFKKAPLASKIVSRKANFF